MGFFQRKIVRRMQISPVAGTDFNKDKVPTLTCEKFWGPPPDKYFLMKQIYAYLLSKFVQEIARGNCDGCKIESGSQTDHMGVQGCLNEEINHTREYYGQAKSKCTPSLMLTVFETFRRHIGATPIKAEIIAEAAINFLSDDFLISVMASPIDRSYIHINMLLDSVVDVVFM